MRHRKSFNHLSRKTGHRRAMLANMASSLIIHKRIQTTTAKAKALRMYVEPLLTKSKDDSTHSRRVVFSQLQSKEAVTELFREVSPKIAERPGGYTRILKTGTRLGDNADMCIIELVDYNENLLEAKETASGKSGRRRRRGGKKKSGDEQQPQATAPAQEAETPAEEAKAEAVETAEAEAPKAKEEAKTEEKEVKEKKPAEEEVEAKKEEKAEEKKAEAKAEGEEKAAEEKPEEEQKKDDKKEE